jgi:hypothetical protein
MMPTQYVIPVELPAPRFAPWKGSILILIRPRGRGQAVPMIPWLVHKINATTYRAVPIGAADGAALAASDAGADNR